MSWVTVVWSMDAGVCATLMAIYLAVGLRQRNRASLYFSITSLSACAIALAEIALMKASTPERYSAILRWAHVPIWALVTFAVLFTLDYLRAGRRWLAAAVIATRTAALLLNFVAGPNLNYVRVRALRPHVWAGDRVMVADGVANPWMSVGQFSLLLLTLFLADVIRTVWRRGDRRRALTVGGSLIAATLLGGTHFALTVMGVLQSPSLISVAYFVIILAMAYELTIDLVRASELSAKLRVSEEAHRESERRMALAVEAAHVGLWVWEIGRDEIWRSETTRILYGDEAPAGVGIERFLAAIHPDDRDRLRAEVASSLEGRVEFDSEHRVLRPGSDVRWVAARGRIERDAAGRPLRMRGVSIDVTASRQAELEADRQRRHLAHLSRATLLGELSGSLAHEINQPLMAILSNAEAALNYLSQEPPDLREVRAVLGDIVEDDKFAGEILRRQRLLLQKGEALTEPLEANPMIHDVLRLMRSDLLDQGVSVSLELGANLPKMCGDRVQIQQVLVNLLANACDAMASRPPDGRRLSVESAASDGGVRISISDQGGGLPDGGPERVFEPFFTTKPDGMGLGLTVCRTIIAANRGRLWCENNAGAGATFHFTLPAAARTAS